MSLSLDDESILFMDTTSEPIEAIGVARCSRSKAFYSLFTGFMFWAVFFFFIVTNVIVKHAVDNAVTHQTFGNAVVCFIRR